MQRKMKPRKNLSDQLRAQVKDLVGTTPGIHQKLVTLVSLQKRLLLDDIVDLIVTGGRRFEVEVDYNISMRALVRARKWADEKKFLDGGIIPSSYESFSPKPAFPQLGVEKSIVEFLDLPTVMPAAGKLHWIYQARCRPARWEELIVMTDQWTPMPGSSDSVTSLDIRSIHGSESQGLVLVQSETADRQGSCILSILVEPKGFASLYDHMSDEVPFTTYAIVRKK